MRYLSFTTLVLLLGLVITGCTEEAPTAALSESSDTADLSAAKHHAAGDWTWVLGERDCDRLNAPSAVAMNGDKFDLSLGDPCGSGNRNTFSLHPKTINGSGTYRHTTGDGSLVSEGTWDAVKLISFVDFGTRNDGTAIGLHGGTIRFEVEFDTGTSGILTLTCTDFGKYFDDDVRPGPTDRPGPQQGMTLHMREGATNFTGVWTVFPFTEGFTFFIAP